MYIHMHMCMSVETNKSLPMDVDERPRALADWQNFDLVRLQAAKRLRERLLAELGQATWCSS